VKRLSGVVVLVALLGAAGCATRADLLRQDRRLRGLIQEQRRHLQAMQREIERLRAAIEEGGAPAGGGRGDVGRMAWLEQRVAQLERELAGEAWPEGAPGSPSAKPPEAPAAPAAPAPEPQVESDGWRREVAQEQTAAGAVNVPERAEYLAHLDTLAVRDCARAIPQLNGFAAARKDSPLADNALYWAGRCYELLGRQEDAVSKFYEVGTRYPKGDKAPAALWAQGNLFLAMGNTPDARIVFSKLIRDYPAAEESARARQTLTSIEN
jgi:TolA-binding protein